MTNRGGTVHAFRHRCNPTTKATDHELQKYDIFTRYGHAMAAKAARFTSFRIIPAD
jgi:hypothetical protein